MVGVVDEVGGGGWYLADSTVLPGVLALTSRSLCDRGFRETNIGSNGSSSSLSCCQMMSEGRAGWWRTLNKVVVSGRVLLG